MSYLTGGAFNCGLIGGRVRGIMRLDKAWGPSLTHNQSTANLYLGMISGSDCLNMTIQSLHILVVAVFHWRDTCHNIKARLLGTLL